MKLSIVIPTLNEQGSIQQLIERIDKAMSLQRIKYEIIVVDDHSTDLTQKIVANLTRSYPLTLSVKNGQTGKAQSLIQGFTLAKYDIIAMIDGDLQYPPEAIPAMCQLIGRGFDIIIANRDEKHLGFTRKIASKTFRLFFGSILHSLDFDVQSGLKVFRKEVIDRVTIKPSPWTFDLPFLVKAKQAGYTIGTVAIPFAKRQAGKSKVGLVKATFEIGLAAVLLKLHLPEAIPIIDKNKVKTTAFHYKGTLYNPHTTLPIEESAVLRLSPIQMVFLVSFAFMTFLFFAFNWHTAIIVAIALLTFFYFIDMLFSLFIASRSFHANAEIKISKNDIELYEPNQWPHYTILCPLYKEWEVLPQFIKAMQKIDYPQKKLQVLLLLEEDDTRTIYHANQIALPKNFEVIVVPHGLPKTKPKACNYGLSKATGDYIVIYDAEDIPDPLQLKKSVITFSQADASVACVQAKLNYYNPKQNVLTRMFTAEYSLWFDAILPGLQTMRAPIPLGGTSNHFRVDTLKKLHGWDAFNVTEDCDLGIRLARYGYTTLVIDSTTSEEANSQISNWLRQRSRWIKGYIQTYFVHTRDIISYTKNRRYTKLIVFQLIVGGKLLSLFINPMMWVITIAYFTLRPITGPFIHTLFPTPILYMAVSCLVFGNFLMLYYYMIGLAKRGTYELMEFVYLVPFYWLGMSVASWLALYDLIVRPHYWAKTVHGLHLQAKSSNAKSIQPNSNEFVDSAAALAG